MTNKIRNSWKKTKKLKINYLLFQIKSNNKIKLNKRIKMSTERELTPGGPTEYHTISFADLAATLQLNGGISLIGKAFGKFFFFTINLNEKSAYNK